MPNYIALDSCTLIYLSQLWSSKNENPSVLAELEDNIFSKKHYANIPYKHRPAILQDKYLGLAKISKDGKKTFRNLLSIYYLLKRIQKGDIQVVITPIVLNELNPAKNIVLVPFIKEYCKIVSVATTEEARKHAEKINELAYAYTNNNAMDTYFCAKENSRIPENDAYIMAEASLLGLNLVTSNGWDFLDRNNAQDKSRLRSIFAVNETLNHTFKDQNGNQMTPRPMTEHDLRLLHYDNKLRFAVNSPLITNPNRYRLIDFAEYTKSLSSSK